mgnify:CR=1 FL=1
MMKLKFLLIGMSLSLIPNLTLAQCVATADCAALGYTETSCPNGGGVRCPWNTSLMYCGKKCPSCPACDSCCPPAPAYPTCESLGNYSNFARCQLDYDSRGCINGGCRQTQIIFKEGTRLTCVVLDCTKPSQP